jgi:hypothetical protein
MNLVNNCATTITKPVRIDVAFHVMKETVEVAIKNVNCGASIQSVGDCVENTAYLAPSSALGNVSIWVGAKCHAEHPATDCHATNDVPGSSNADISVPRFVEKYVLLSNTAKHVADRINGRRRSN